jgi:PPOX class probable F420-dependent enzyme
MSLAMTEPERQEFLAGAHVAVLAVAGEDDRAPLLVPVWYAYEPGGLISVITGRATRKAERIRAAGRVSLCAQTEQPPYQYVTVEGRVVAIEDPADQEERRSLAYRYLGAQQGDAYLDSTASIASSMVVIRIEPERWFSRDYS